MIELLFYQKHQRKKMISETKKELRFMPPIKITSADRKSVAIWIWDEKTKKYKQNSTHGSNSNARRQLKIDQLDWHRKVSKMNITEGYGKEGIKQLKKDHADLKKNPPKIEKIGNLFAVMVFSNVVKKYIPAGEYLNPKAARADLKIFVKNHKETLAKILRLSKDVQKESEELTEGLMGHVVTSKPKGKERFVITKKTVKKGEDPFKMYVIDNNNTIVKDWGTHPSLKGAIGFAKKRGFTIKESLNEAVKFKKGDKVTISNPRHNDNLDGATAIVKQHLGNEVSLTVSPPIKGARGVMIDFTTRPAKQLELVKESLDEEYYGVFQKGGSIGGKKDGKPVRAFETKKEAQDYAKRMRKQLSPGEKKYYGLGYIVKSIKGDFIPESEEVNEALAPSWKVSFSNSEDMFVIAKNEKDAMKIADRHITNKYGKGKWGKPVSAEKQTNSSSGKSSRPRSSSRPRGGRSAFGSHKFGRSIGGDASNYRESIDVVSIYKNSSK